MNHSKTEINNIQIAYIGGGSRGWAWGLMSDLALENKLSGTVKLYDIDYRAASKNAEIGNRLSKREDVSGKWNYEAVETIEDALIGSDFVIISILPGTFTEMESDVHLPEEYGIFQPVGDTVGPGGMIRALRTIPIYAGFAEKIRDFAPDAWVINYTNPMTLCTRTLYEVFPEIKAIGCCHEVFGTQKLLASMLEEVKWISNVNRRDIKVNVLGINHFTWIDQASYQGIDLFPLYREFVDRNYEEGFEGSEKNHWMNNHFASAQRVKFDLFRKFGLIAAAGDRHLAEFMPNNWYLKDLQTIQNWKFSLTDVSWRIQNQQKLAAQSDRLVNGKESFEINPTGEEGIDMIKALLGLEELVTNVNMPNHGQMGNIPTNSVVETNAIFGRDSIKPVLAGELPPEINNLVMRHVLNQETTLQAALQQDNEMAFRAFANDPLVNLPPHQAKELFNKMLENTKAYLPV
ncbi:alpha-glucosidase/alpha-galactosidase [Halalkalibacter kiskunsagensis]|uniref:Alpha-glucosidase/alpha-galactosidase n=1 Tax=Halalkalibacter kiskunsagensis TaxID=1548599 RepID=A0ABV6KJC8_9BACI